MKKYVQTLRDQVVEMSRNFFDFADGEEFADFDDVVDNPMWAIMRRGMWERVMLCSYGQFDGKAILLMGKVLPLEGLRIAKHANGILAPGDAQGPLPSEHCPMVLHDGYRHFKALLPFCEISESEASGGTDGELEARVAPTRRKEAMPETTESESTGSADEEPAALCVVVEEEAMPEITELGDTGGTEKAIPLSPRSSEASGTPRRYHDWSDDEVWYFDDQNYLDQIDVESEASDDDLGWSVVGKKRRVAPRGGGDLARFETSPAFNKVSRPATTT